MIKSWRVFKIRDNPLTYNFQMSFNFLNNFFELHLRKEIDKKTCDHHIVLTHRDVVLRSMNKGDVFFCADSFSSTTQHFLRGVNIANCNKLLLLKQCFQKFSPPASN